MKVSTLAGNGNMGFCDGKGTFAQFTFPSGVDVDTQGNVYVIEKSAHRIRKVSYLGFVSTISTGTYLGHTLPGAQEVHGQYNSAAFLDGSREAVEYPCSDIAVRCFKMKNSLNDYKTDVFAVDINHHSVVEKSELLRDANNVLLAGDHIESGYNDGSQYFARFSSPCGISLHPLDENTIYIADSRNHVIRKVNVAKGWAMNNTETTVGTVAGCSKHGLVDGAASLAKFWTPTGIDVDVDGTMYVSDRHGNTIRFLDRKKTVITVAGNGTFGYQDGKGNIALFANPGGIAIDRSDEKGSVFVADMGNHCIRIVEIIAENFD
eukprot:CAMPEP_0167763272 /NCGR_PEP_ID=MMETSP0110_2-20121227/13264_1 /TAXON_ID=629695 /ORGANISM="Gymnochlora sp., Strain CCMP2014" /LENGTH=319 /DNA_ID=CAMNT_0007650305 /DNA_START=40 /DNA_END=999 /DNA_ORIENTATION=+